MTHPPYTFDMLKEIGSVQEVLRDTVDRIAEQKYCQTPAYEGLQMAIKTSCTD